jgi:hypothetical protein
MVNLHLGNEDLPYRVKKMDDVVNLRTMVLDLLEVHQIQRKVVVEPELEAGPGVGDNDYAIPIQMVEATWRWMAGIHPLHPLMMW